MTSEIRTLPAQDKRVETGTVQFENDWPGTFIRGDDSFGYVMYFELLAREFSDEQKKHFNFKKVKELFELLSKSNISTAKPDLS